MPRDWIWPTNSHGWPLAFIAQVALDELPRVAGLNLPRKGALFFFHDGESWGFKPEDIDGCRVLYSPEGLTRVVHKLPEDELEYQFAPVQLLVVGLEKTLPSGRDSATESFGFIQEQRANYFNVKDRWDEATPRVRHRIGGHPDLIQGDAKLEARLVSRGIDCGGPDGYKIGQKRGLFSGAADWELLLQVDSDEKSGMMWGDGGRIYFLIQKDDLAKRQFDKVRLVLQCY
jgi:uncharacterized protein YwqG